MFAGTLTDLIDIEEYVQTSIGSRGEPVGDWQVLYSAVPANVTILSGRKLVLAKELFPTAQYTVQFRWLDNVSVKNRIHFYFAGHLPNPTKDLSLYVGHYDDTDEITLTCSATEL